MSEDFKELSADLGNINTFNWIIAPFSAQNKDIDVILQEELSSFLSDLKAMTPLKNLTLILKSFRSSTSSIFHCVSKFIHGRRWI